MPDRYAHCTFCGARFPPGQPWPRRCGACGETSYLNPKPVAVALQPVGSGLLVIRRAVPPAVGSLALPGGYIDAAESWQQAASRELLEETGVSSDPDAIRLFDARSAPDGTLLIFGLLPGLASAADLPAHTDSETAGREVLERPAPLGFDLHTQAANRWFTQVANSF
ncbi:NUDIX domain-containing protein [Winogradskya consettensis]|uniref:NUDIX hydrolase n=1 Tax=Winogradskya consettensis TaxID=113560 RepID=A0A919T009_9ACTN|nr:NUDIX domain-containing protein [Actinoplanes consettensis]GIM81294.1 NUDIX hydrolase [Actinoplanes consettensis]